MMCCFLSSENWLLFPVAAGELIEADFEERENHIEGIVNDANIGIARIAFDDNGESRDFVVILSGEKENLRVESKATNSRLAKEVEGGGTAKEFKTALGIGKFEISKNEALKKVKDARHKNAMPRRRLFEV